MATSTIVYIQAYSVQHISDGYIFIQCPLETLVVLCVYEYCQQSITSLTIVLENNPSASQVSLKLKENTISVAKSQDLPWQVSSCKLPVITSNFTVITGLCAVVRNLSKLQTAIKNSHEHPEGILGFRSSCLQAPNEVSVWTKFCEVEILDTVNLLLNESSIIKDGEMASYEIPENIARFEQHLGQPLRIHNVYKLARDMANLSINNQDIKAPNDKDLKQSHQDIEGLEIKPIRLTVKNRYWKSNNKSKQIESSTPITELDLEHKFAEGPYVTLADVILYPYFYLIFSILDKTTLLDYVPKTVTWFTTVQMLSSFQGINNILSTILIAEHNISEKKIQYSMPTIKEVSLYKSDPKRSNPKKRLFTKEVDVESALGLIADGLELELKSNITDKIDWSTIPLDANPYGGHLPDKRMERKTQQLENLALATIKLAKDGDRIIDFCSGSGHLGILLAHLLPKCTIILLENKEQSLNRAQSRVHSLGMKNVYFFQCNLDFFKGNFDIGVALHACGVATDLVLENCISKNASFIVCPCCYGSLHSSDRLNYPRSKDFSAVVPVTQYMCIGHAADQTHVDHPMEERGARCMSIIDSDRARHAMNNGYSVSLTRLIPLSCTPKNMLIIGISGK